MRRRLLWLLVLVAMPAFALDRHVFLNSTGGGTQLNDCPNPLHNSKGVAGNTDELTYCFGADLAISDARIICDAGAGCKSWTVTTAVCTNGANNGTVTNVTNGVLLQLDGDAGVEPVYGHPQACVYNMAQSDSCEVHAGVYRKPGAYASEDALTGDGQTDDVCGRSNCWKATVVAFGIGPNLTGNAYGTSSLPAYLRGAVLNGSTDTWDSDGDKVPDCNGNTGSPVCSVAGEPTSYFVTFSGDVDGDSAFDRSIASAGGSDAAVAAAWNVQSGAGFTGDSHYALITGCGDPGYNRLCRVSFASSNDWIRIDTNADGVMDTIYGQVAVSSPYPPTSYFYKKDIEFTGYNGGDGTPGSSDGLIGIRQMGGHITEHGNKMSTGLDIDHIYVHGNDYSICAGAGTGCETMWSVFHDQENSGCLRPWLIKNSLLYQENEKLFNDDCGSGSECGCGMDIADNRIVVNITSPVRRGVHACMLYIKGVDTVGEEAYGLATGPKRFVFRNNDVDFLDVPTYKFHDLQSFGNMRGHGLGEFWVYGNVFRLDPDSNDSSGSQIRFEVSFSSGQAGTDGAWKYYLFNNTYDFGVGSGEQMDPLTATGTRLVERNNAYFGMRDVHATTNVTTIVRTTANEICSLSNPSCTQASTTRTVWFSPGAFTSGNPTIWNGLTNYVPNAVGATQALRPLYENGSCDPDGNGQPGVDYDRNGVEDLTWTDIAGNIVSCPTVGSPISIGAIQPNSDGGGGSVCGNGITESPETCDDGSAAVNNCAYGDDPPLQQVCNGTCSGNTNCASPQYCGDSTVQTANEQCDGILLNGHTCAEFGCSTATPPTCVACVISSAGCTCNLNPTIQGVSLFGVSFP